MPDVDAGELGAELLLGDRPHRLAGVSQVEDQPKRDRHDECDAKSDDARYREERDAEIEHREAIGQIDRAGIGMESIEQRVFDDDGEAEGYQQDIAILAMRGGPDDETLQAVSQNKEQWRQQEDRNVGVEPEQPIGEERGKQSRPTAARRARN